MAGAEGKWEGRRRLGLRLLAVRPAGDPLVAALDACAYAKQLEAPLEVGLPVARWATRPQAPSAHVLQLLRVVLQVVALHLEGPIAIVRRQIHHAVVLDVDRVTGPNSGEVTGRVAPRRRDAVLREQPPLCGPGARSAQQRHERSAVHDPALPPRWARRAVGEIEDRRRDRKSTRLNSSHTVISYAVFCLKKKKH